MAVPKQSQSEKLREFYDLWAKHVAAGGDTGDDAWNRIAATCEIEPPQRKATSAGKAPPIVTRSWEETPIGF